MKPPYSHSGGHETEHDAAASITAHAVTVRRMVLGLLQNAGASGLTDDEGARLLASQYGYKGDRLTFGRRRHELAVAGQVAKTGERRLTPSGRQAIVWTAVATTTTSIEVAS